MRILTAVAAALLLFSLVEAAPKENEEPPALLVLQVEGGSETVVQVDKPLTAMIGGKPVKLKITALPHRVLDVGGVRLHYPRRFTFEYEKDADMRTWTLDGPSTTVVLFRFAKQDPKETLKNMESEVVQQWAKSKVSDTWLPLRKRRLQGRRIAVEQDGASMWHDYFAFDAGADTYALLIQHLLTDDGMSTPETMRMLELLSKKLELR